MEEWIKKSDAIEAINKSFDKETLLKCFVRKIAIDAIIQVPSADRPQGEWIPCTEREPNEFEDVLVLLSDGTMDVLQLTDYLDIWGNVKWCHAVHHGSGCAVSNNDVVAWMPLPEPWKGADDAI